MTTMPTESASIAILPGSATLRRIFPLYNNRGTASSALMNDAITVIRSLHGH